MVGVFAEICRHRIRAPREHYMQVLGQWISVAKGQDELRHSTGLPNGTFAFHSRTG